MRLTIRKLVASRVFGAITIVVIVAGIILTAYCTWRLTHPAHVYPPSCYQYLLRNLPSKGCLL